MIYEYQCTNLEACGAVTERIQRMADERPEVIPCKYCQSPATFKISAPAVLTGATVLSGAVSNKEFDLAIGHDSNRRWKNINERQAQRDKVRKDNNQVGLAASGYENFQPITEQQRQFRTNATKAND